MPVFIFDIGAVVVKWSSNDPIYRRIANEYKIKFPIMKRALVKDFGEFESGKITTDEWISGALSRINSRTKSSRKKRRKNGGANRGKAGEKATGSSSSHSSNQLLIEPFSRKASLRLGLVRIIISLRKRGYRVYALTNTSHALLGYMQKQGWFRIFDGYFASCELHCIKPDPTIFEKTLRGIGSSSAGRVVFIDDNLRNVRGARDFGFGWALRFENIAKLKKDISRIIS